MISVQHLKMKQTYIFEFKILYKLALMATCAFQLTALQASPMSEAMTRLSDDHFISRELRLSDLGVNAPRVLTGMDTSQVFYMPVPKNVPIYQGKINFDANYRKGDSGPFGIKVSVNDVAGVTERLVNDTGSINKTLPVTSRGDGSGFIRLAVQTQAKQDLLQCGDGLSTLNSFSVLPDSRLSYLVDSRSITSLSDAWNMLPVKPTLMISGEKISRASYDSAWRMSVALNHLGRKVNIQSFPSIGQEVDIDGLTVPSVLSKIPAFTALQGKSTYQINDVAEIGALIFLNAVPVHADLVIMDSELTDGINTALNALRAQLESDSDAVNAFDAWREKRVLVNPPLNQSSQIWLSSLGKQPVVMISAEGGEHAVGILDSFWKDILLSSRIEAFQSRAPELVSGSTVRLINLGNRSSNLDVLSDSSWTTSFPLSAISRDSQSPNELVLDVGAAPGEVGGGPIVSVFWNEILLIAHRMKGDGGNERIVAHIPRYVVGVNNSIAIRFQRQPFSDQCKVTPQAYPVAVLPTSHIVLSQKKSEGTFVSTLPFLASTPSIIVPERYLDRASSSLKSVTTMVLAGGLPATRTALVVVPNGDRYIPKQPFLSMEVPIGDVTTSVEVSDGPSLRIGGKAQPWINIAGLKNLSVAELVNSNGEHGVFWQTVGSQSAEEIVRFSLDRGDLVVIGPNGPVAWVDSKNPSAGEAAAPGGTPFYGWGQYLQWAVPMLGVGMLLVLFLLLAARSARRKRNS